MPEKMIRFDGVEVEVKTESERKLWAESLADDDLITEFGIQSWAEDRCCCDSERLDSDRALKALSSEMLRRMKSHPVNQ